MVKAFVHNGVIVPREPLPEDWAEGVEVAVERVAEREASDAGDADAWMDAVEAIAAQGDPADDQRLEAAIRQIRHREKELARKSLPLEP
ncbi:MAG: hypothetical protein U0793_03145 [Gemmataceae bacterium]